MKKNGVPVGTRPSLNLIPGADISITVSDDGVNDEVDVTIASAAAGAFDPSDIAWHNYYWAEGVDFAARGLADGAAVSTWDDESGNGHDLLQATAANRPLYRAAAAGLNGKPAVDFDGINDVMISAAFATSLQRGTVVAIVNIDAFPNVNDCFITDGTTQFTWTLGANANGWQIYQGANTFGGVRATGPLVLVAQFGGPRYRSGLEINGYRVPMSTTSPGSNSINGTRVGDATFDGQVGFVGVIGRSLTAHERHQVTDWARTHYAVS